MIFMMTKLILSYAEPRRAKMCLPYFQPRHIQTSLVSYRNKLQIGNSGFSKRGYSTIKAVTNKDVDQTAQKRRLVSIFYCLHMALNRCLHDVTNVFVFSNI